VKSFFEGLADGNDNGENNLRFTPRNTKCALCQRQTACAIITHKQSHFNVAMCGSCFGEITYRQLLAQTDIIGIGFVVSEPGVADVPIRDKRQRNAANN
jgi:hypothetical protein